jgi:hypothetical protein
MTLQNCLPIVSHRHEVQRLAELSADTQEVQELTFFGTNGIGLWLRTVGFKSNKPYSSDAITGFRGLLAEFFEQPKCLNDFARTMVGFNQIKIGGVSDDDRLDALASTLKS